MKIDFNSVNAKLCIGILVAISVIAHSKLTNSEIEFEDIVYYSGKLENTMVVRSHGGEMNYEFIEFSLSEIDEVFSIRSCAFLNLDVNGALNLKIGDQLKVGVAPDSSSSKAEVVSVEFKKSNLLSFESYSYCSANFLTGVFYFLYFFSFILIARLIIRIKKEGGIAFIQSWFKRGDMR